ncbi:MAG: LysR family transcriptional regulator, partial [Traorella sp.]
MDLNQLKYFEIIAKNENLSKAEKILHIAQPALSTSLARMEKQLGVKLFERNKGRLELNNYGEILLKYVLRINAEYEAALHEIEITKNENENTLNIAVLDMGFSLDLIFQFITNNPHIKVNPRIIARDPEIELDLDEYDIIITPLPETFPNMEYVPILTEQFSLVVSNDHKFCKQNKICFEDLNGENIICTAYRSHFANYVQKL